MSKRIIALLLALVMVFALCACGNGGNGGNSAGGEDVGDQYFIKSNATVTINSSKI